MRVVIIDDEVRTRASLIHLLKKLYPSMEIVGEADNGQDGMSLVRDLLPDLAITDIKMPRMNGLDMIEHASQVSERTHFLVLSGYAEFELARRALKLSVADYLLKPVTVNQLKTAIDQIAEKARQQEEGKRAGEQKSGEPEYSAIVSYIVNHMKENYAKKLYMEDYAKKLNITPEYASNLFIRETGKKFSFFLRDIRIEKAKELLDRGDLKIYEVAYLTGFADVKYFCKVFKEAVGASATSYIRNRRME